MTIGSLLAALYLLCIGPHVFGQEIAATGQLPDALRALGITARQIVSVQDASAVRGASISGGDGEVASLADDGAGRVVGEATSGAGSDAAGDATPDDGSSDEGSLDTGTGDTGTGDTGSGNDVGSGLPWASQLSDVKLLAALADGRLDLSEGVQASFTFTRFGTDGATTAVEGTFGALGGGIGVQPGGTLEFSFQGSTFRETIFTKSPFEQTFLQNIEISTPLWFR